MLDLSIITVTYQSKDYIDACILSVTTHILNCTYEHIIVDNGSTDGTVELILKKFITIMFISLKTNTTAVSLQQIIGLCTVQKDAIYSF